MAFKPQHACNPDLCPFCGSDDIGALDYSFGISGTLMVDMDCSACCTTWREDYQITHRVDRKDGDEIEMPK